ncbi:MAG: flagellar motor switch protein FliG [Planctomycetota bacterium]|nr:flagellar motor switch protein FliG [Planctomycetota bacterium]MDA1162073.1 flagellar motor switch protein FliG [Planctomycetota bacterium]
MDDLKKAAIVLLSLDKAAATRVLSHLPKEQMERLTVEIARTDDVTQDEQDEAIKEFRDAVDSRTVITRGSLDFANELLSSSIGEENASEIVDSVRRSMKAVPFGFLHKLKATDVMNFISEEHPQTIALIMSNLPTGLAADLLKDLPPDKQLDVVRRVANMEQTAPEIMREIEESLKSRMVSLFNEQSETAGGIPLIAQILNIADRNTTKDILEGISQESEYLAGEIQRLMFVFDDIAKLDDKSIQTLLKEIDNSQWAMALKGASPEIRTKILGNLSKRAAENLEEEMGYLGSVRLSDVESVQQQIVDTVRRLEDAGTITVTSGDGDQFVS